MATGLNVDAPEFHPNKTHLHQHHHFFYYNNKLFPKLQPQNHLFYTTNFHPLFFHPPSTATVNKHHHSFRFHPTHYQLTPTTTTTEEPEPEMFHKPSCMEKQHHELKKQRLVWRRKEQIKKDEVFLADKKLHKKSSENERLRRQIHGRARNKNGGRFPLIHVRPDGDETSVMIKNIPSKYTTNLLVEFLENHCRIENAKELKKNGEESTFAFDFVYLPIDFCTGLNKGYAFVNFTNHKAAWDFLVTVSGQKWELFLSSKIREVVAARLQGKEKLECHFQSMVFPCASEEVLPVSFSPPRDGVIKGNQRTIGRLLY